MRDWALCATRELVLDLIEPDPSFLVPDLLYHVEADPSDVVDADLVEGSLYERALYGVSEVFLVDF